jgi:hypothetical protein
MKLCSNNALYGSRYVAAELKAGSWQAAVGARQSPAVSNPLPQSHSARKIPQEHSSTAKLFSKFHVDESTWMDGWLDMHSSKPTLLPVPASKAGRHGQKLKHNHDYNQFFLFTSFSFC